jgi:hypothetical protein
MRIERWALTALLMSAPFLVHGSGGKLDANGCHTDPVTGKFHCHNAAIEQQPASTMEITVDTGVPEPTDDDNLFADCTQVRGRGVALPRRGERGYAVRLDKDRNGVACD